MDDLVRYHFRTRGWLRDVWPRHLGRMVVAMTIPITLREEEAGWKPIVKPLEWRGPYGTTCMADTIVGGYETWKHPRTDEWVMQHRFTNVILPTEAEARAAAQADYEARILSALVLPNPPLPASINEMEAT